MSLDQPICGFEVPPDQISGASLLVAARQFGPLDAQARISLDALQPVPMASRRTCCRNTIWTRNRREEI
ncbi:hypothetical protein BPNPMPFG_002079 [Mesorhizobium sp. AR07]|uniref:hypothetical protein n=1 Tax=Mesorhizobium sp. AR07 TaxID=2865838 RepID=UPI002160AF95|nr:hypothetical protein [Mesorhizobium sp. AR07]UVK48012.1 hypothetical protein BPNPMPFG_002079 [Mesorhizobium sp. AR07]